MDSSWLQVSCVPPVPTSELQQQLQHQPHSSVCAAATLASLNTDMSPANSHGMLTPIHAVLVLVLLQVLQLLQVGQQMLLQQVPLLDTVVLLETVVLQEPVVLQADAAAAGTGGWPADLGAAATLASLNTDMSPASSQAHPTPSLDAYITHTHTHPCLPEP